ncbi:glycosyltransferase [Halorubrum sp. CBA1125]|uniref:glycosyltransferase family 4 protein n=1 Tax=Halorubrum sp. CBA1125 TaxID=2668072 RepID=UPI0012E7AC33|nr:glycosyltransferase family 4 protein [Halorubrum sp. CBA1125]MUW13221.1 glycosyltransferase [Halorubrum sp. CBA1125]
MKVLVCLPDPRLGGPQKSAMDVAEVLSDKGIKTEFLVPQGHDRYPNTLEKKGFAVHQLDIGMISPLRNISNNMRYVASFPKNVKKIKSLIHNESIDVVNARSTLSLQSVGAAVSGEVPLVWHFNDATLPRPFVNIVSRAAKRYADEIVVSAENVKDHYFRNIEPTKIYPTVNKNKFDPGRIKPLSFESSIPLEGDSIKIGLVGNISPVKGYDTFIEAFDHIADEYPNTVSLIVGKKLSTRLNYLQNLQKQISRRKLENQIYFLGWKENIAGFLSAIDIFVLPSHSETGPMTLMEAMMMKKPIVTTNVGVVPEQLEDGEHAWIVDAGDTAQLAAGMQTALENQNEWEKIGKASRELALNTFTANAAADRYESVYRSAISNE